MENHTILVVDDDKMNLKIICNILNSENYTVFPAINGVMALKYVEKKRPSLILLDLMMPGMGGRETFAKIRENPDNRDIPIIFLTADENPHTEAECLELGAADFITKPIVPLVLLSRIEKTIELEMYKKDIQHKIDERTHLVEEWVTLGTAAVVKFLGAEDRQKVRNQIEKESQCRFDPTAHRRFLQLMDEGISAAAEEVS